MRGGWGEGRGEEKVGVRWEEAGWRGGRGKAGEEITVIRRLRGLWLYMYIVYSRCGEEIVMQSRVG